MSSSKARSYNEDEVSAPAWLDAKFFTLVLREHLKTPEIVVRGLKLTPGTVKGDHYASVMFRAVVEYTAHKSPTPQTISLIVKTMPESDGHKKDMLRDSFLFRTEIGMYAKVLPKVHEMLRAIGDTQPLCPPCVYWSLEPRELIIFEDMLPLGYSVIRGRALTLADIKLAYAKLAKLHAISYKLLKQQPELLSEFRYGLTSMPGLLDNGFVKDGIHTFVALLKSQPQLRQYLPYFEAIKPTVIERLKAIDNEYRQQPLDDAYYVLCHGDFHIRNMMFKHNAAGGDVENCILLDFQISNVGTITYDVIYSIYMLMSAEMRAQHKDALLHFYFDKFVTTLKQIQYDGPLPKLIEFRAQIVQRRDFEIFLLHTFLPLTTAFFGATHDPTEILQSEDCRRELYNSPAYIAELEILLKKYLHLGYFENLC